MSTASISGLGSGLDTAGIVSQLMQLEALPQTQIKARVTAEETVQRALQSLNTKVAGLATQATDLGKSSSWTTMAATSSHSAVTVNATASASLTSFAVTVTQLAAGHRDTFAATAGADTEVVSADPVTGKRTLTITHADQSVRTIDAGDGSLKALAAALNDPESNSGVRATMLQVAPGSYRLVLDSTVTGADSGFTVAHHDGELMGGADLARRQAGADAQIEVAGFSLTSKSNTFTDVTPGVSISLAADAKSGDVAQVAVTRDASSQTATVKGFITSLNSLLADIDVQLDTKAATSATGQLSREASVRSLRNELASALYPSDGSTMSEFGLQIDRYGKFTFDEEVFAAAYAADPTRVAAAFGSTDGGFAARVHAVADAASNSTTGTLTGAIQSRTDGIARLNDSVEAWDRRLELRRATLQRTYTALDVALSKLNAQGTWLSGQISSLPSWS